MAILTRVLYQYILPCHQFSGVLPWCFSISPSLPLCYFSVSNAYPNAPPTIPTVAPYKRFCSFLPWSYFRASTPWWSHVGTSIFPLLFHCFTRLNFSIVFPSHQIQSFYFYFAWHHFRPTAEPQFFHCLSIVLLRFFIIVPRFSIVFYIANGLTSKPQFLHCLSIVLLGIIFPSIPVSPVFFSQFFSPVLLSRPIVYAINLSFHFVNFPVFCHGVTRFLHHYPYVTSVCLTLTQMHVPQSPPLHRINGFARFFHGLISVLLLHGGHTSEPQFFHCFSIVSRVLYAIMVPHRSLNFSIVFPSHQFPSVYSYFTSHHFGPTSELQCFHCFSIVLLRFFIIVARFSITFPSLMVSHRSHSFFHCVSIVLLDIIFPSIPVSPVFFS